MNDDKLKRLLEDIGREDVPDDLDLWAQIKDQLEHENPPASSNGRTVHRLNFRPPLSRIAAAFIAVMLVGTVYAVFQNRFLLLHDPGLERVERTVIQQEQEQNGVLVVLDWAYADGNRIVLEYDVLFDRNEIPDGFGIRDTRLIRLSDNTVLRQFGGGGGGGGDDNDSERDYGIQSGSGTWDASSITGTPEALDLRLELTFGALPFAENTDDTAFDPLHFSFDFTVPFIPAVVVEPQQTVESDGLAVTLAEVSVTPSQTRLRMCYTPPDTEHYWELMIAVDTGEEILDGLVVPSSREEQVCGTATVVAPYDLQATTWEITATGWRSEPVYTPENRQIVREIFADAGIDITFVESEAGNTYFTIDGNPPQGVNTGEVWQRAVDAARMIVDGEWTFEVEIPSLR